MKMIDIGNKKPTLRQAVVEAKVFIKQNVINLIKKNKIPKGNCLQAAKVAGIIAAKKTPTLIPLCHSISIDYANIDFIVKKRLVKIITTIKGEAKTGVEMEGFTATAVAALTIYDMCKGLDREMIISDMRLVKKSGGKSSDYIRKSKILSRGESACGVKYKKSKIRK